MTQTLLTLVAAAGLALVLAGPAAAQECLSGREIQQAINAGEIVPLNQAMAAAGVNGQPLRTDVCKRNGSYEYHVNIMDADGDSDTKVLNAQGG